jgi:hypothetical protein
MVLMKRRKTKYLGHSIFNRKGIIQFEKFSSQGNCNFDSDTLRYIVLLMPLLKIYDAEARRHKIGRLVCHMDQNMGYRMIKIIEDSLIEVNSFLMVITIVDSSSWQ